MKSLALVALMFGISNCTLGLLTGLLGGGLLGGLLKPKICGAEYSPVCGNDNKEYWNSCHCQNAGIGLWRVGKCSLPPAPAPAPIPPPIYNPQPYYPPVNDPPSNNNPYQNSDLDEFVRLFHGKFIHIIGDLGKTLTHHRNFGNSFFQDVVSVHQNPDARKHNSKSWPTNTALPSWLTITGTSQGIAIAGTPHPTRTQLEHTMSTLMTQVSFGCQ